MSLGNQQQFAVVAQKGGVGKTTTVANLAAAMGEAGRRVLAVDLDEQFDLTRAFGRRPSEASATAAHILNGQIQDNAIDANGAILEEVAPGVDLIAGDQSLRSIEMLLVTATGRETMLRRALDGVVDAYDVIFYDCPRSLGQITQNAMIAAGELIVPVSMRDPYSFQSAAVVKAEATKIETRLDYDVKIACIIRTMVEKYTLPPTERTHAYRVVNDALNEFGERVAHSEIPYRAAFSNSAAIGTPLVVESPDSIGAHAYRSAAAELLAMNVAVAR